MAFYYVLTFKSIIWYNALIVYLIFTLSLYFTKIPACNYIYSMPPNLSLTLPVSHLNSSKSVLQNNMNTISTVYLFFMQLRPPNIKWDRIIIRIIIFPYVLFHKRKESTVNKTLSYAHVNHFKLQQTSGYSCKLGIPTTAPALDLISIVFVNVCDVLSRSDGLACHCFVRSDSMRSHCCRVSLTSVSTKAGRYLSLRNVCVRAWYRMLCQAEVA